MEKPSKVVVVDASVCVKWYLDEEYSDRARLVRDMFVKDELAIAVPSLIFYETLNALRFSGLYNQQELEMAADSMSKYGLETWQPTGEVYRQTARISYTRKITVYDASYIALAEHLHSSLITADSELVTKFPGRARHIKSFKG